MLGNHPSSSRFNMKWIILVWTMTAALVLSGCGQPPKTYRVGVLSGLDAFVPAIDGFKSKLTELGYVEGKNIAYDVQKMNVDVDAYRNTARKFVEDKVDLIFVFPTDAAVAAKAATQGTDIPVIFDMALTDGRADLIDSVREPGGNITGVRFPSAEIAGKRLEILLEIVPAAKQIWAPYLKNYSNVPGQLEAIRALAKNTGITLSEFAAASPLDLQAELDRRAASGHVGIDAILLIAEPLSITPDFFAVLAKFGAEHRTPIGGALMTAGDYGSLFGLLPNAKLTGEQAAILADKALKGVRAGAIPVVTTEGYLQINMKAAQALGITVPDGLLTVADEIIR